MKIGAQVMFLRNDIQGSEGPRSVNGTLGRVTKITLHAAVIDLGAKAFAPGQPYVAFSRLTSLDGLYLRRPLTPADIIVDQRVAEFMSEDHGSNRLI